MGNDDSLYYQLGEIKKGIGCPLCKKIIAEKDLKEANSELKMRDTSSINTEELNQDESDYVTR